MRIYLTGRTRPGWVGLPDWPPATADRTFYLQSQGRLGAEPLSSAASPSVFRFDPADPTPTIGGRLLTRDSGYRDDTRLARRDDVLSFTSAPLQSPMCVCGHPVVELAYDTDNPHFDVFVRLSEVDGQGRSRNVSDGFGRFSSVPDGPIRRTRPGGPSLQRRLAASPDCGRRMPPTIRPQPGYRRAGAHRADDADVHPHRASRRLLNAESSCRRTGLARGTEVCVVGAGVGDDGV